MAPHAGAALGASGASAAAGVFLLVLIVGFPVLMYALGSAVIACLRLVTGGRIAPANRPAERVPPEGYPAAFDGDPAVPDGCVLVEDELLALLRAGEMGRDEYRRRIERLARQADRGPWPTTTGGKA
jgi:hypothetical protein